MSAALAVAASAAASQGPGKLEWLGATVIPTGVRIGGVEFGGLSSVAYDGAGATGFSSATTARNARRRAPTGRPSTSRKGSRCRSG